VGSKTAITQREPGPNTNHHNTTKEGPVTATRPVKERRRAQNATNVGSGEVGKSPAIPIVIVSSPPSTPPCPPLVAWSEDQEEEEDELDLKKASIARRRQLKRTVRPTTTNNPTSQLGKRNNQHRPLKKPRLADDEGLQTTLKTRTTLKSTLEPVSYNSVVGVELSVSIEELLPTELIELILSFVDQLGWVSCKFVCRRWSLLLKNLSKTKHIPPCEYITKVASNGWLSVLQWARANGCSEGQQKVLQWLRTNRTVWDRADGPNAVLLDLVEAPLFYSLMRANELLGPESRLRRFLTQK
jgi:hypothetical protein